MTADAAYASLRTRAARERRSLPGTASALVTDPADRPARQGPPDAPGPGGAEPGSLN